MRRNSVEIKISFGRRQVDGALEALGLGTNGERREIGFLEDNTVGMVLPLFHQGIVLRVRQIEGERGDSTVKLRPCRRSQLTESWLGKKEGDGWELRVEEDWAGTRRVLAASCVADLPGGRIGSVRAGTEPIRRLFNEGQERFLSDCAGIQINLNALTLLPAVTAIRWDKVRIQALEDVVAERWTIDDLDFLELSIRRDTVEEALAAQEALEQGIQALNLERDDANKSKTELVLAYLVGLAP
jgi:hypothetical protein